MADKQNQQELNKLREEGRVSQDNLSVQDREAVKNVAEGKSTVNTVEQFIDSALVLEAAKENEIYLNMLEPCLAEGINITERLQKYFEENKVKPSELSTVLQEEMSNIRIGINKDTKNLFFDESGLINVDKSIEKARRYGVKVANYLSGVTEEKNEEKSLSEDENPPYLINGIDVYEEIASKDESFFIEFQERMTKSVDDLNKEYKLEETFETSTVPDSKINKEIQIKLLNISEFLKTKLSNMSLNEKNIHMLKAYYLFQELENIDLEQLEGITPEVLNQIKEYKEKVKLLYTGFSKELGGVDFENITEEELIATLRLTGKFDREALKREVNDIMMSPRDEEISIENANRAADDELRKRNLLRNAKLFKALSLMEFGENNTYSLKQANFKKGEGYIFRNIKANFKDFDDKLNTEFENDNLLPLYTDIIRRKIESDRLNKFEKVEDLTNIKGLAKEFNAVIMAFNIVSRKDDYAKLGYPFEEDLEHKRKAFNILKEVFPDVVLDNKNTIDGLNQAVDTQAFLDEISKRYSFFNKLKQIKYTTDLLTYAEEQSAYIVKAKISAALLNPDGEEAKNIDEIFDDKKVLEEVNKKRELDEKSFIIEKRLSNLTSEIYDLINKRDKKTITYEEELKLVEDLVIVARDYHNVNSNAEHTMYKMIKAELATYLPGAYDNRGYLLHEKIDDEYTKYLLKNGILLVDGQQPIEEAKARIDKDIVKEYFEGKVVRDPKALAQKVNQENMEKLSKMDKIKSQEKILRFLATMKELRKTNPNYKNDESFDIQMAEMESKVQQRIRSVLSDDEESQKKAEEIINNVNELKFDKNTSIFAMRELKIFHANNVRNELTKKYAKISQITDPNDIKEILSMYIGTKNDVKNNLIDRGMYYGKQRGLMALMKKISPDLLQKDNKINEDVLLDLYNQNFGTDLTDVNDAYSIEEDRLLRTIIQDLTIDVMVPDGEYKYTPLLNIIKDDHYSVKNNLQMSKLKEKYEIAKDTLAITSSIQDLLDKKSKGEFSKEDETSLIQLAVATIGIVSGQEKINPTFDLTKAELKHDELNKKAFVIASENLLKYFPDIKREDGVIDMAILEKRYGEYLRENNISIQDKEVTLIDSTVDSIRKSKNRFGPEQENTLDEIMEGFVTKIDEVMQDYEVFKIKQHEIDKVFSERAEDLVFSSKIEDIKIQESSLEDGESNIKVNQEEESVSTKIAVEEMSVGEDDGHVVDNHPVKLEEKGFFKNAFKSISKLIKEKLTEIKNNIFGESDDSSSGDASSNATSTTSGSGTEKKSQSGQENNMFGPQVNLDLKAANENVGKTTELGRGETSIDEK